MNMSKITMERLISENEIYVKKIISHSYRRNSEEIKEELYQQGLIGLWKGIKAYYERGHAELEAREFVDTICAYIRYEMRKLFSAVDTIRVSVPYRRSFYGVKEIINSNPEKGENEIKTLAHAAGLHYEWYQKVKNLKDFHHLDMKIKDGEEAEYSFLGAHDKGAKSIEDRDYINYIVDAGLTPVKPKRDREIILTWLRLTYAGYEENHKHIARAFELSAARVGRILENFRSTCRFVRDSERDFYNNPSGYIRLPKVAERERTHNGKKVPGVKWVLKNRKWSVRISNGKCSAVFIGLFTQYEDAVRARRDAEIEYRGYSDIEI